jgi:hypothetical protein
MKSFVVGAPAVFDDQRVLASGRVVKRLDQQGVFHTEVAEDAAQERRFLLFTGIGDFEFNDGTIRAAAENGVNVRTSCAGGAGRCNYYRFIDAVSGEIEILQIIDVHRFGLAP